MPIIATPFNPLESLHRGLADSEPNLALAAPHAPALQLLTQRHFDELMRERPAGSHLEFLVLREIARNAAALDLAAASEVSAIRSAEQCTAVIGPAGPSALDSQGIAALKSPAIDQVLRYRAVHQRGLCGAVRLLPLVTEETSPSMELPQSFRTEAACVDYMRRWQQQRPWACPACQSRIRYFLANLEKFECSCGQQYSTRIDTIFAESHVPLTIWFHLVTVIISQPQITNAQLGKLIGKRRLQTVHELRSKIVAALQSDEAETLLAGLDGLALHHLLEWALAEMQNDNGALVCALP